MNHVRTRIGLHSVATYLFVLLVVFCVLAVPAIATYSIVDKFIYSTWRNVFFLSWFANDGMGYLHITSLIFAMWIFISISIADRGARFAARMV